MNLWNTVAEAEDEGFIQIAKCSINEQTYRSMRLIS